LTDRERQMLEAISAVEQDDDEDDDAWVRVKASRDPAQVYSIRIPIRRVEQLRQVAVSRNTTPSQLMREWVIERLDADFEAASTPSVKVKVFSFHRSSAVDWLGLERVSRAST
jgi:hypothetical protein